MRITLITKQQYNTLLDIQKNNSVLTFQNDGYEYINQSKLTEEDKQALNKVETMLKHHILGFEKFNNFRIDKQNNIVLRFQYNWTADEEKPSIPFTGVGYLRLNELLNGFDK